VAFVAAAVVALAWLNQGPSMKRYDELSREASAHPAVAAWLPLAFLYRRSADEQLYFALANAVRGAEFDEALIRAKRGEAPDSFRRLPPADGRCHWPYAEVAIEYPPLVLPFVALPALFAHSFDGFALIFGALMAALLLAAVGLGIDAVSAPPGARAARWWIAAALLVAQGGLAVQRLDAIVAFLLALSLWAATRRRRALMGFALALAAATKGVPGLVVFPLLALERDDLRNARCLLDLGAGMVGGLAVGVLPLALGSPVGLADLAFYHGARGLHVESTYGALLSLACAIEGRAAEATLSFGSYNIDGPLAQALARASTPMLCAGVLALSLWLGKKSLVSDERRPESLVCAAMAAIACVWLLGKTFSPQYMTWAIPMAVMISDRRVALLLGLAMALSQAYLRGFYDAVVATRPMAVLVLVLRWGVLVALAGVLLQDLARLMAHTGGQAPRASS
jgi:hypothetical protein